MWLVLRADVRRRWRAMVSLALLLGLVGGVVLTTAAGARRTESAYPRLLTWANAAQADIIPQADHPPAGYFRALARLRQVSALGVATLYQAALPGGGGKAVDLMSSPDGRYGVSVDRVKVLSGRMFDPRLPGLAVIDQQTAALQHLSPGGTVRVDVVPSTPAGIPDYGATVHGAFRVTAIVAFDTQIVATGTTSTEPAVLVSAPFTASAAAQHSSFGTEATVRLRPGASVTGFTDAAAKLAKHYPDIQGGQINVVSPDDQVTATERAIRPQAVALALFAALAGLIALVVLSQLLSRQLALDAAESGVLRSVGLTRGALAMLSLSRLAMITVTGAAIAIVTAVAASPLMPIGPARLAEPSPGVSADPLVLSAGAAAVALLPLAVLVPAAWRAARLAGHPAPSGGRPSRLAALLTGAGSLTGGIGVRMAFEPGQGPTAVPVRSGMTGSVVAVAAVVAAAVFGASLIGLVSTPQRYGQNWDQITDLGFGGVTAATAGRLLGGRDTSVTQFAPGDYGQLTIDGRNVAAIGLDQPPGGGYLTVLDGRAPDAPDEIALGARTLRDLRLRVGQAVKVTHNLVNTPGGANQTSHMRITGVVVLPAFSRGSFEPTGLGTGAVVTASVLSEPSSAAGHCGPPSTCYNFFLLRHRPGTDLAAAARQLTTTLARAGCPVGTCVITADQRPGDIKAYTGIRDTPLILGAVLAVLAAGTLAHVLLTGVRRRRRDLALLKTLGFTRSQVLRVVLWEATAFAVVALAIGLPAGVAAGRWAWALFAGSAGVSTGAEVPLPWVLLAIPATLLLSALVASWPGWQAARLRPWLVLRTE